jgi:hypothetical protein
MLLLNLWQPAALQLQHLAKRWFLSAHPEASPPLPADASHASHSLGLGRLLLQASSFFLGSSILGFLHGRKRVVDALGQLVCKIGAKAERGRDTNGRRRGLRKKLQTVELLCRTVCVQFEPAVSLPRPISLLRRVERSVGRIDERGAGLTSERSVRIISEAVSDEKGEQQLAGLTLMVAVSSEMVISDDAMDAQKETDSKYQKPLADRSPRKGRCRTGYLILPLADAGGWGCN